MFAEMGRCPVTGVFSLPSTRRTPSVNASSLTIPVNLTKEDEVLAHARHLSVGCRSVAAHWIAHTQFPLACLRFLRSADCGAVAGLAISLQPNLLRTVIC